MKTLLIILAALSAMLAGCSREKEVAPAQANINITVTTQQPSFRSRYNALADAIAPSLAIRDCKETKGFGRNRDALLECPTVAHGGLLTISSLNNMLTGAELAIDVSQFDRAGDLMNAGRIFLRLARGKDSMPEDPVEMMQMVVDAQKNIGRPSCEDTPSQQTRFCIVTNDKSVYHMVILNPDMWK